MIASHDLPRAAEDGTSPGSDGPRTLPPDGLLIVPCATRSCSQEPWFPIALGRERSIAAAQQAVREERQIGLLMQRDAEVADPAAVDLHRTGTIANILRYVNARRHAPCRPPGRAALPGHRVREGAAVHRGAGSPDRGAGC